MQAHNVEQLEQIFKKLYSTNALRVKNDVYGLLQSMPTLMPKESSYISNDGSSLRMLVLDGTLPITFKGAVYHIPINIWLNNNYPLTPPLCYVVPTLNMSIRPKHKHVDPAGMCYLPYLNQWRSDMSNLLGLVYALINVFSYDPPVYAKVDIPPNPIPNNPINNSLSTSNPSNPILINPNPRPVMPSGVSTSPTSAHQTLTPVKPKELDGKALVTEKLINQFKNQAKEITEDMTTQIQLQEILEKSSSYLDETVQIFIQEKGLLAKNTNIIATHEQNLDTWLNEHENHNSNVDEIISPADVYSNQMFDLIAEDQAIEDTLYNLHTGLIGGVIDGETYLKQVRVMSREQFLVRATAQKVFELQRQQV